MPPPVSGGRFFPGPFCREPGRLYNRAVASAKDAYAMPGEIWDTLCYVAGAIVFGGPLFIVYYFFLKVRCRLKELNQNAGVGYRLSPDYRPTSTTASAAVSASRPFPPLPAPKESGGTRRFARAR